MRGKNLLKALGLSLMAALGLMAFTAVGAQAANLTPAQQVHGDIYVLGSKTTTALDAKVEGTQVGTGILSVPALAIEINCTSFKVISGLLGEAGHGTAEVLFEGCVVNGINEKGELTGVLPCTPLDSGAVKTEGHIRAKALVLVILHENKDYLLFEQVNLESAQPLSLIEFKSGTGCPLPLKPKVTGSVNFEILTGDKHSGGAEVVEPLIKASNKAGQELLSDALLYGINPAFLSGHAKLFLIGAHKGCTWGVL